MVQAAAAGFDFSTAAFRDRRWWLKLRWFVDRIEDNNTLDLLRQQHAQHLAIIDYSTPKSAFDNHWNAANDLLKHMQNLSAPWLHIDTSARSSEVTSMLDKWKKRFGDYKDPKVQAKFKKIADAWRKQARDSQKNMFSDQKQLRNMVNRMVGGRKTRRPKGDK